MHQPLNHICSLCTVRAVCGGSGMAVARRVWGVVVWCIADGFSCVAHMWRVWEHMGVRGLRGFAGLPGAGVDALVAAVAGGVPGTHATSWCIDHTT